jgi:hypothetical protein
MRKNIPYYSTLTTTQRKSADSNRKLSLGWRLKRIKPLVKNTTEYRQVMKKLISPVRDISSNKKIKNFLKKHKVYITLTSSPKRLQKLEAVLATLDLQYVHHINIVLPLTFGRDNTKYSTKLIAKLKKFPKVKIIRVKKDLGPITKMLPTLEKIKDKQALVISIDDDMAYPMGMVNEMIYQKVVKHPDCVIEGSRSFFRRSDIRDFETLWPQSIKKGKPHIDVVEGWLGVVYNKKLTNTKMMKDLSKLSKDCYLSDDIVISYVLAKHNICRQQIENRYTYDPYLYKYGAGEDALHRGGGLDKKIDIAPHVDDLNFKKYRRCLKKIKNIHK